MDKVIRNGLVAVLISRGFGAGWYTWNNHNEVLLYHPKLVEMVEAGRQKEIDEDWVMNNLGIPDVYTGGAADLCIVWIPEDTYFQITEYDGAESVLTQEYFLKA